MIISGTLTQHIVPRIHSVPRLDSIFLFCDNRQHYERWAKAWFKIKGFFTEIQPLCEAIKQVAERCDRSTVLNDITNTVRNLVGESLDRLDPSFIYTKILVDILMTIEFKSNHLKEFVQYCREMLYDGHVSSWLDKFEQEYYCHNPIWWYTDTCALYSMTNRALRTMDVDLIIKLSFFICDIHRQIEQLHRKQFIAQSCSAKFTVYRSQGIHKKDFEKIVANKGGLLAFNRFLSTSKNREVSMMFAEASAVVSDMISILFVIVIDPARYTTPFASTDSVSYFKEVIDDEVLFSTHSVFRIGNISHIDSNDHLFQVELTLTDNHVTHALINSIREKLLSDETEWVQLDSMLIKICQFASAQQICEALLKQTTKETTKGLIYNRFGMIKARLGQYKEAIAFYEQSITINQKHLPNNHPILVKSYSDIGNTYSRMAEYPKALSSLKKVLTIQQNSLPSNHPDLALSYSNIGKICLNMNSHLEAFTYFQKALHIQQELSLVDHPELASIYSNMGLAHTGIRNYWNAQSFFELAVDTAQKSLPSDHPDLHKYQIYLAEIKQKLH